MRRFCQEAIKSEDFAQRSGPSKVRDFLLSRHFDLLSAIVNAAEKGAARTLSSLGNFIVGWDFVRFAFFLEKLTKHETLPDLPKIKEAVIECRAVRNEYYAHRTYNPNDQGLPDAKLASILHSTRNWLPKLNKLNQSEQKEIYEKCEVLESILFLRETSDQNDNDVPTSFEITDIYRLL
jgi:hypothetical protein